MQLGFLLTLGIGTRNVPFPRVTDVVHVEKLYLVQTTVQTTSLLISAEGSVGMIVVVAIFAFRSSKTRI